MNTLEARYAAQLRLLQASGEVQWFAFECLKLRLAGHTFYTPDFLVMRANDELEIHEVKGHWEDDARVKVKCAAAAFPFRFMAVTPRPKREGGGWRYEHIGPQLQAGAESTVPPDSG